MARKLGRPAKERVALLRNQVSELLWYEKLETTIEKAKEVRSIAEKMITLAMNTADDVIVSKESKTDDKGKTIEVEIKKDGPKKLAARRKLMSYLRDLQEVKGSDESKKDFALRTKDINHPLIEKLYGEYAVRFNARKAEDKFGGYTRIYRTNVRHGDAAQMAYVEIIK